MAASGVVFLNTVAHDDTAGDHHDDHQRYHVQIILLR